MVGAHGAICVLITFEGVSVEVRYLGGKLKLGRKIASAIGAAGLRSGWEPFCGGCGASPYLATLGPLVCSDIHPALIAMWQAVQGGWRPPHTLAEEAYTRARGLPDSDPLKAFAAFGCSFGGKEWGGFARTPGRDLTEETARRVSLDAARMRGVTFACMSFFDPTPGVQAEGCYIYCDPPYVNTTTYRTGMWDSARFWDRARAWSVFCPVYISEFEAPSDAVEIAAFPRKIAVDGTRKTKTCVDRLYRLG